MIMRIYILKESIKGLKYNTRRIEYIKHLHKLHNIYTGK